jgi:hypothetical protein
VCSVSFRAIVFGMMDEFFDIEVIELVKFFVGVKLGSQIKP